MSLFTASRGFRELPIRFAQLVMLVMLAWYGMSPIKQGYLKKDGKIHFLSEIMTFQILRGFLTELLELFVYFVKTSRKPHS